MKMIVKIGIAASAILFLLGIAGIAAGALMGVTPGNLVYSGHIPGLFSVRPKLEVQEPLEERQDIQLPDIPSLSGGNASGSEEYYEFRDVENLELDLPLCELHIFSHPNEHIAVEADNVKNFFHCSQDGDTLILKDGRPSSTVRDSMKDALSLTLYLPEHSYEDVSIDMAVGDFSLVQLHADTLDLEVGVGNVSIGTLAVSEASIHAGVGEFHADSIQADEEATVEVGTGNITLDRFDGESLDIECGAGNAEITAAGNEQDYNYKLDAGLGNVSLCHEYHLSGHHHGSHDIWEHHIDIHNSAGRDIYMNCGLGNATLNFTEE